MSRPVSETCPVCGTPGRIVGGDEGTQHFEPEAAWVSPAVTRRAEIAERKALAALLGEAWLAHDLANDAYLAEAVPRPTVAEYAGFAADIAARLHDLGVRVATPTPPEIDELRLARALQSLSAHRAEREHEFFDGEGWSYLKEAAAIAAEYGTDDRETALDRLVTALSRHALKDGSLCFCARWDAIYENGDIIHQPRCRMARMVLGFSGEPRSVGCAAGDDERKGRALATEEAQPSWREASRRLIESGDDTEEAQHE